MHTWLLNLYRRYSPMVWLLTIGRFLDQTTTMMALPFMAIFVNRAGASAGITGLVLALNPIAQLIGSLLGGQWSDAKGRRPVILFSMGLRVIVMLSFAFASQIWQFAVLSFLNGLVNALFNPAYQAAIADATAPSERLDAFSLSRVMSNLGVGLGPILGGIFGVSAQRLLFSSSALGSLIVAAAFFVYLKEPSRHMTPAPAGARRIRETLLNWGTVLTDRGLFLFIVGGILSRMAYGQINSTLPLHLAGSFADFEPVYSLVWTINGLLIVLIQLPVSAFFKRYSMVVPAVLGPVIFSAGYALFALAGSPQAVYAAAVVWTLGEIVLAVPQTTFPTDIAPPDLRARYAGAAALDRAVGGTFAPILGTLVLQTFGGGAAMLGAAGVVLLSATFFAFAEGERSRRLAANGEAA